MSLDDVEVFLVDSFAEAANCFSYLSNRTDSIAVDTETTGFKWQYDDYARTVQTGDHQRSWMIELSRWSGLFVDLVRNHRGRFDFMNAKFDVPFLRKNGIEVPTSRIDDVGVMSHILEPHMSRKLKEQASRHVDPRAGGAQRDLEEALSKRSEWTWATIPVDFEPYWVYGALDAVLTRRVRDHHWPLIQEQAPHAYEIENAFQWVALTAETNGVPVDVEYAEKQQIVCDEYCRKVEDWCKREYGISPGSNQKVIEKLIEVGFDGFDKRTASGALSLDKEVLEGIDHPLARSVLLRRQLQKVASTYLRFYAQHGRTTGLIHPSINTLGARTSRMSMSEPNFQNLPRVSEKNKAANVVRNCVAAQPGHVLIMVDFDQIEMRGLAIMSEDEGLRGAFRSENDFFVNLAQNVFQDPTIVKADPRRQIVKNVGYAKIYGAGVSKLAITAGVSYEQAHFANAAFDQAYPRAKHFLGTLYNEAVRRQADEGGLAYTVCPLTGRRHYADRGKEYALANYKIQGWAASLFKMKMLELANAGLDRYIILFVHDEVILHVPIEDADDVVHTLRQIMNDTTMFPIPISAGVSWGYRWGEKMELRDDHNWS